VEQNTTLSRIDGWIIKGAYNIIAFKEVLGNGRDFPPSGIFLQSLSVGFAG
jgi:hypothetical protein